MDQQDNLSLKKQWIESLAINHDPGEEDSPDQDVIFSANGLIEYTKKIKNAIKDNYIFTKIQQTGENSSKDAPYILHITNTIANTTTDIEFSDNLQIQEGTAPGTISVKKNDGDPQNIYVKGFSEYLKNDQDKGQLTIGKIITDELSLASDFTFGSSLVSMDTTEAVRKTISPQYQEINEFQSLSLDLANEGYVTITSPVVFIKVTIDGQQIVTGDSNGKSYTNYNTNAPLNCVEVKINDEFSENKEYFLKRTPSGSGYGNPYVDYKIITKTELETKKAISGESNDYSITFTDKINNFKQNDGKQVYAVENNYLYLIYRYTDDGVEKTKNIPIFYKADGSQNSYEQVKINTAYAYGDNSTAKIEDNFFVYSYVNKDPTSTQIFQVANNDPGAGIPIDSQKLINEEYKDKNGKVIKYSDFLKGSIISLGGITAAKDIKAHKVHGAVFNDYAEYRHVINAKPGMCVIEDGLGTLSPSTKRLQLGANIVSDTFGFSIGETSYTSTPIAVCGRVLAYPFEDKDSFQPGQAVCSGPNGTISHMTRDEIRDWPDAIVGYVSEIPNYKKWGSNNIEVDGRIWIKIH